MTIVVAGVNVLAAYGSLCGRDRQTTENSSPPATTSLTSSGVIPEHWPMRLFFSLSAPQNSKRERTE
jgi:hypothetical protein